MESEVVMGSVIFTSMLAVVVCFAAAAHAQTYDMVINNGRVMDPETGIDSVANVGITAGWITRITKEKITGNAHGGSCPG